MENGGHGENPTVTFHYLKANQFRVIHVDGALGGVTPRFLIHMSLYSERPAIPQQQVFDLTSSGKLKDGPPRAIGKDGVVRELEVDAMMDLDTAKSIGEWLLKQVATAEAAMKAIVA